MKIEVPQDRKSSFEPQVVKKGQKDISDIDHKIISMYAKGITTRQISDTIEDIYGFDVSEGFISDVTGKILVQLEERQNQPLDDVIRSFTSMPFTISVRDNAVIIKKAAYGHLEKLAFCDFFEIATSFNSLDYRELKHRIFKVTSKNCSF